MNRIHTFTAFVSLALCISAVNAAMVTVDNQSFESFVNGTDNDNDPATFTYPDAADWTYSGTPNTNGLLGVISDSLATNPDTPAGNNWVLMDSRTGNEHLYQAVDTIALGDVVTLTARIGRTTNAGISNFEVALYRSVASSGTPDLLLADINNTDAGVAALALGGQTDASVVYNAIGSDAGETLFIRIGLKTLVTDPVTQALVDDIRLDVSNAVPAPAALPVGLIGLAVLTARRRPRA